MKTSNRILLERSSKLTDDMATILLNFMHEELEWAEAAARTAAMRPDSSEMEYRKRLAGEIHYLRGQIRNWSVIKDYVTRPVPEMSTEAPLEELKI